MTTAANAPVSPPVVGIGASAGGLEALREMLSAARGPTGLAFVIVQHLDPNHESMLAQLLGRHTTLEVLQCEGGERIAADTVYIIPPGHGLAIVGGVLQLTEFAQPRGLRRPIDDFFISLASDQQAEAACVILSGTGADGTTGLRAIKEHGGISVVQEPGTARYDGMPLSAVGTGLVDYVKAPGEIVECLISFFDRRNGNGEARQEAGIVADHIDELCRTLRQAVGHDFSGYKRTTLVRRVERRMQVLGIDSGSAYLARLKSDTEECDALFRDFLINVTRFFRDPEIYQTLREQAIEPLVRDREPGEELRVWIPGCSSGEEAYSIAMLFAEAAREADERLELQIIATDIDERMLSIAREGSYPAAALADIPLPLRERYLIPHADRFTIAPQIRDLIRFSNHSIVKDPPFSKIDLVSCRNLLIYFDDRLQQTVMPLLHYAVRPDGYMLLGPSESVGRFEHLFATLDHQARLFRRNPGPVIYPIDLPANIRPRGGRPSRRDTEAATSLMDEGIAVRRLLDRYVPASMVLDADGGILAAYGPLSRYFEFPVTRTGGSSAITLARPGLRNVLGRLLREGRETKSQVASRDVEVMSEHGTWQVDVICDPLPDGSLLFVFREGGPFRPGGSVPEIRELDTSGDHVDALEDELRVTRHRLRSTVEELETANEELKSSNEEMMSMNEELQSTNEELSTVNDELKSKVDQLTVANSDLRNFFDSTELAVVVLDRDMLVRSYTDAAKAIFPLQPGDRGRPLQDVASRLAGSEYLEDARTVADGAPAVQRRVTDRAGKLTYSLRVLPYRTQDGETDGVTLVLTDITDALSLEDDLARERERLDMAIQAAGIGIWEYHIQSGETVLDGAERRLLALREGESSRIDHLINRIVEEDRAAVEMALRRAATGAEDFEASFRIDDEQGVTRWIKGFGRLLADAQPQRLVGVSIDVTPEHALAETRALMLREMNHRVKNLFAIIGGMISTGARSHSDVREFALDMRERIAGLGRAHSLAATADDASGIALGELVERTIEPYRDHVEVTIAGPPIQLDRRFLSPLALILHEWATNAVKYGALGAPDGSLSVTWERTSTGARLKWEERGAAPASVEPGQGFGTLLVDTSARQLRAAVRRSTSEDRFTLELDLPETVIDQD